MPCFACAPEPELPVTETTETCVREELRLRERVEGEDRGRGVAAGVRDEAAAVRGDRRARAALGEPVGGVREPVGRGVGPAVVGRVEPGVLQPEVARKVHDLHALARGEDGGRLLRGDAVGRREEEHVVRLREVDRPLRGEGEVDEPAQVGVDVADRARLRAARDRRHADARVVDEVAEQLHPAVARAADDGGADDGRRGRAALRGRGDLRGDALRGGGRRLLHGVVPNAFCSTRSAKRSGSTRAFAAGMPSSSVT